MLEKKTALIITHRLSAMEQYDQIILLNEHHIAATGTHAELLRTSAEYREMTEASGKENLSEAFGKSFFYLSDINIKTQAQWITTQKPQRECIFKGKYVQEEETYFFDVHHQRERLLSDHYRKQEASGWRWL